jgi:hypothetical protein
MFAISLVLAAGLAGCDAWETAPPPAPPSPAPIAATAPPSFEDNGCLGYLLLNRAAVLEGRAEGDSAALEAPIAAWRARGRQTLSAEELVQYETSSVAEHSDEGAQAITARARECVISAPASQAQEQEGEGEATAQP